MPTDNLEGHYKTLRKFITHMPKGNAPNDGNAKEAVLAGSYILEEFQKNQARQTEALESIAASLVLICNKSS